MKCATNLQFSAISKKASANHVNKNIFYFGLSGWFLTFTFNCIQIICIKNEGDLHRGKSNFIDWLSVVRQNLEYYKAIKIRI
ncbi:hypothetical protein N476_08290 [Pseudoalteromonas luteoviolacea H33]|uniref:Uncharacterized protein n=1 Tax=Pseudoalteromonas luteoviolacea H33 TaxID=1365251 RepID=A0A167G729_9GAMM|nr:hypothetical protein N476_08290 [Pseudoalteromonas luteoviolacea H33]KZN78285.1 hypothetical protein N477_09235 [Pseudoalteromonas luteoviolacea H33-S]